MSATVYSTVFRAFEIESTVKAEKKHTDAMEDPEVDKTLSVEDSRDATTDLEVPLLTDFHEQISSSLSASYGGDGDEDGASDTTTEDTATNDDGDGDSPVCANPGGVVRGRLMLLFVSFLFGSLNVSFRLLYDLDGPPSPSVLNLTRGWMVSLAFLPIILCRFKKKKRRRRRDETTEGEEEVLNADDDDQSTVATSNHAVTATPAPVASLLSSSPPRALWKVALELSVLNFSSMMMSAMGLTLTPAARASFFGQTTVIMVPLLSLLVGGQVKGLVWLGCICSVTGIIILSQDGETSPTPGENIRVGDLFNFGATFLWSCIIIRTSQVGSDYDEINLQGTKNMFIACQYTVFWLISSHLYPETSSWDSWNNPIAWAVLAYSAIGPGCLADVLQQKGQELISASESSLFLAIEPVSTAILSRLILGEETSWLEKLGGACLVAGAIIASQSE